MPRNIGTGIYFYPDGTLGNDGQTIFSARYNTFLNDLAITLNQALPVNMGGTGADNATTARDNLDAEVASAQVTNYDTHAWESGSFYSLTGATNGPVPGNNASGVAIVAGADITLQAYSSNLTFSRIKSGGVWGAWVSEQSANDARYVNVTGDTMTGDLGISKASPILFINSTTVGGQNSIIAAKAGLNRWAILAGDGLVESGGNAGSDFQILRYNDAGSFIDAPLRVTRANGEITITKNAHFDGGQVGGGAWYHGSSANQFFVGTDAATNVFRIFAAGAALNALAIDGPTGAVTARHLIIQNFNGSNIVFDWDGAAVVRSISGGANSRMFDMSNSPSASGYQKLVTGQIFQFGAYGGGGDTTIAFPIAFPNTIQAITAMMVGNVAANTMLSVSIDPFPALASFVVRPRYQVFGSGAGMATQALYWTAVGW